MNDSVSLYLAGIEVGELFFETALTRAALSIYRFQEAGRNRVCWKGDDIQTEKPVV